MWFRLLYSSIYQILQNSPDRVALGGFTGATTMAGLAPRSPLISLDSQKHRSVIWGCTVLLFVLVG